MSIFVDTFCDRVHGIAEIHRWQDKSVNGHDQFQIAFMDETDRQLPGKHPDYHIGNDNTSA